MSSDSYTRTMQLADERPDLIPLVRLILEMGDEAFNAALDELVERGLLVESDPARVEQHR